MTHKDSDATDRQQRQFPFQCIATPEKTYLSPLKRVAQVDGGDGQLLMGFDWIEKGSWKELWNPF